MVYNEYNVVYTIKLCIDIYCIYIYTHLVGGLEHDFLCSPIVGMMIQSDFHIFQRGRYTTNQMVYNDVMGLFLYFNM